MSRRKTKRPDRFTGAHTWRSPFASVHALWAYVDSHPDVFRPVLAVLVHVPSGNLHMAEQHLKGYAYLPDDLLSQLKTFLTSKDGALDKRRGDLLELVAWSHGPFNVARGGEQVRRWHEARYPGWPSHGKNVDVAFQVQGRCEAIECKVNLSGWTSDPDSNGKVAFIDQLRDTLEGDPMVTTQWVGYATAEDAVAPSVKKKLGDWILAAPDIARAHRRR